MDGRLGERGELGERQLQYSCSALSTWWGVMPELLEHPEGTLSATGEPLVAERWRQHSRDVDDVDRLKNSVTCNQNKKGSV